MSKKVLTKDGSRSVCLCAYQVAACCQCENTGNSPENKSNIKFHLTQAEGYKLLHVQLNRGDSISGSII